MELTIKNYKGHDTHDGVSFTADVYVDGVKAFVVENDGNGGENLYIPFKPELRPLLEKAEAYAKGLPALETEWGPLEMDLDLLIADILEKKEEEKQLRRWCRKKVVFRLKDDPAGEYRTLQAGYSLMADDFLVRKYGDKLEEIINKRFMK